MGYVIRMPQMGMSMDEGTVVEWEIEEGGSIDEGDVVVVVESEKASNEVEAREGGVLRRILVAEGESVEPGDPIGILAGADEDLSQFESQVESMESAAGEGTEADEATAASADEDATAGGDGAAAAPEGVKATPGARKLADEEGVDLAEVEGTGPQGVITEDDVEDAAASAGGTTAEDVKATPGARKLAEEEGVNLAEVEGTGPQGVVTDEDVEAYLESAPAAEGASRTVTETRELTGMQATISERLSESYREAVHVTLNRSFDTGTLREVSDAADEAGAEGSITDLLIKAVGDTLEEYPEFNALFEDGEHRLIEEVNVGVAVDVEAGLVTPVVPDVVGKSAEAVNETRGELTGRVQSGEFTMDDLTGGTFTISNLGLFGVDDFDPVINPPQIAILGVGRIRDDGSMTLSLSFDHRVVNGADAARFLDSLVERLTDATTLAGYYNADVSVEGALGAREIEVETPGGLSGRYRTAYGSVDFDEPEDVGGTGGAPSPVDHLLGALGSCLSLTCRQLAGRDEIDVGAISATVRGSPEHGGLDEVEVELEIETDADEAEVEKLVTKAERACYVAQSLSEDLPVALSWTRA